MDRAPLDTYAVRNFVDQVIECNASCEYLKESLQANDACLLQRIFAIPINYSQVSKCSVAILTCETCISAPHNSISLILV